MSFNPKPEYITVSSDINIKDFFEYKEMYVTRPPYQRKSVWSKEKKTIAHGWPFSPLLHTKACNT